MLLYNIENAICPRCKVQMGYENLYKEEGTNVIFRCPSCTKPVIVKADTL